MPDKNSVEDHLGNSYPTLTAMCRAYGTTASRYLKRREKGLSKRNSLQQTFL